MPASPAAETPSLSPSGQPTSVVTFANQDFFSSVPAFQLRVVSNTDNLIVHFHDVVAPVDIPGRISCSAVRSPIADTNTLLHSQFTTAYVSFREVANVTIGQLTPLTHWYIYCAATNKYGFVSSLNSVLAAVAEANTTCCYSVTFSAYAGSFYSNSTSYMIGGSSDTFEFTVSNFPVEQLTAQVYVLNINGTTVPSSHLDPIPRRFNFSSSSWPKLTVRFLLTGKSAPAGDYLVGITLSGHDAKDFWGVSPVKFRVLASSDLDSAPALQFCKLSSTGQFTVCWFSKLTDMATVVAAQWKCSNVLNFTDATTTFCSWLDERSIKILSMNLVIGQRISLKSDTIKVKCTVVNFRCADNTYSGGNAVMLARPDSPIIPVVQFSMPHTISSSEYLTVDVTSTTGKGGRPWARIQWDILEILNVYDASHVQSFLNSTGDI
jgi:hypothetical protein